MPKKETTWAGTKSQLWEILVPTVSNTGKPFRTRFHRVWDGKVRAITHGLTIIPVTKGQWVAGDGEVFVERMIPVRIACSEQQIVEIMDMTAEYYDQQAVMAYQVSNNCIIRQFHENEVPEFLIRDYI